MRKAAATEAPRCFCWTFPRRPYSADELLDLLAVGGVTSLRQGGEGAALHLLLAGLLVFALETTQMLALHVLRRLQRAFPNKDGRLTSDARLRTDLAWRI